MFHEDISGDVIIERLVLVFLSIVAIVARVPEMLSSIVDG
jgi:hypothetical protein